MKESLMQRKVERKEAMGIALDTSSVHFVKDREKEGSRVDAAVNGFPTVKQNRRNENPKIRVEQVQVRRKFLEHCVGTGRY
jgi:hypothetical protein